MTMEMSMWQMCMMMALGVIIFIVITGITVYWVVRLLMKKSKLEDHPLKVLKERYAKGEMDDSEFQHKRKLLIKNE